MCYEAQGALNQFVFRLRRSPQNALLLHYIQKNKEETMTLPHPRIPPVTDAEMTEAQKEVLGPILKRDNVDNVFRTMVQHPDLCRRWMVFANHILGKSTLPAREREVLILRIGWLCQAEYEWAQHVVIGKNAGLTDGEISDIKEGPAAPAWSEQDRLLLQATDELHKDAIISDKTWNALSKTYDRHQMMDIVFTVGQYNLVSMALKSFGVQLDDRLEGF